MNDLLAQLFSYLHGIWTYRWSALIVTWVVALFGWTTVYYLPNTYTSYAMLQIDTRSMIQPLLQGLAVQTEVERELGELKRKLFSSRNLEQIVKSTDLNKLATSDEAMDRLTYDIASKLYFEQISASSSSKKKSADKVVYSLGFEGRSPEIAYQIVRQALSHVVYYTKELARTDTTEAQEFLDEQIAEYEKRLNEAEQRLADFTRENIGLMPDESGGYYNKLQGQQEQLDAIQRNISAKESRLAEMRKQLKGDAPLSDSGQQIEKLRGYRKQLQDLLTQYTESHPDVQALRATIADVLASQNSEPVYIKENDAADLNPDYQNLKSEIGAVKAEIDVLKAELALQNETVESLKSSVSLIPEVEANMAKLNRDYNITKSRYLKLVERKELALLAEAVGESGKNVNIRVLSQPEVPYEPSGPDRLLLMSIVFGLAIAAGLAWSVIKFALQPTFIYVRQLNDQIGLPVLGTVGLYLTKQHKRKRKAQLASFLLVFSLLVIAYGYNMYNVYGLAVDDLLMMLEGSDI